MDVDHCENWDVWTEKSLSILVSFKFKPWKANTALHVRLTEHLTSDKFAHLMSWMRRVSTSKGNLGPLYLHQQKGAIEEMSNEIERPRALTSKRGKTGYRQSMSLHVHSTNTAAIAPLILNIIVHATTVIFCVSTFLIRLCRSRPCPQ